MHPQLVATPQEVPLSPRTPRFFALASTILVLTACGQHSTTAPATTTSTTSSAPPVITCRAGHPTPGALAQAKADLEDAISHVTTKISQPYAAGLFNPAEPRMSTPAVRQAAVAASAAVKLLNQANQLLQGNSTLCHGLAQPLSDSITELSRLATDLQRGNLASAAVLTTTIAHITAVARHHGLDIRHP